jgi:fluoride exporter
VASIFLVGIGGFVGSVLRYLVNASVQQVARGFPLGTLLVNVVGCFVIGFLSHLADGRGMFEDGTRAFMFVGILGGFTTFSSFGNETLRLVRADQLASALTNVGANVILGLLAVWLGHILATWLWR